MKIKSAAILIFGSAMMLFPQPRTFGESFFSNPSVDVAGEVRLRFENRRDADFDRSYDDREGFILERSRLFFSSDLASNITVMLALRDSRYWGESSQRDKALTFDQGYIEWKRGGKPTALSRIGRQPIAIGDERLVGRDDWSNRGRVFDAARLITTGLVDTLDVFYAKIRSERGLARTNEDFAGLRLLEQWPGTVRLETLILWFDGSRPVPFGDRRFTTAGLRAAAYPDGHFSLLGSTYYQYGRIGGRDLMAWAAELASRWDAEKSGMFAELGASVASGDRNPGDGVNRTFQELFPSPHLLLGAADLMAWRNLMEVHCTGEARLWGNWHWRLGLHRFWLMSYFDSWYTFDGAYGELGFPSDRKGKTQPLGDEIDLIFHRRIEKGISLELGAAMVIPRQWLEQRFSRSPCRWLYCQVSTRF